MERKEEFCSIVSIADVMSRWRYLTQKKNVAAIGGKNNMPVKIDMEMPENCTFCRFARFAPFVCVCSAAKGAMFTRGYRIKRPKDCPLQEAK